jgi:RNA polymerase sigma factor (sigma-70 family)
MPLPAVARACLTALTDPSDAELLGRYAERRDPEAFAAIVARHGPVVLAACRRVLGSSADAEDAFQAVFLGLARRAGAIRGPAALPAWLHRAAIRTARKALARRRPASPLPDDVADPADPLAGVAWRDLRRVLDEELDGLPEEYRGPLVLCLLDGCTRDEAATRLGFSLATLKRRLDAGRELLRARLLRRGVAPVALAAAVLEPAGLRAAVPSELAAAVARFATPGAAVPVGVGRLLPSQWWATGLAAALAAAGVAAVAAVVEYVPGEPPTTATAPAPRPVDGDDPTLPRGAVACFGTLRYRVPHPIHATALSPDGMLLAVAGSNPVRVYEAATWRPVRQLALDPETWFRPGGPDLAFSADGRFLGHVANGQWAFVWNLTTGAIVSRYDSGNLTRWQNFCGFTPDGLFILADEAGLIFHDPTTGKVVRSVASKRASRLSPDGRFFTHFYEGAKSQSGVTEPALGDTRTGADLRRLEDPDQWGALGSGVVFAPDGSAVAALPGNGWGVHLWATDTGKRQPMFRSQTWLHARNTGAPLSFTPDGRTLSLCLADGDVARWDVATRKELPRLRGAGGPPPVALHALPDGKTLLTPCENGWVRVWDAGTGREVPVPDRYRDGIIAAATRDGKLVAVGDDTGRIDLRDAGTGAVVRTLHESGDPVRALTFSPDGTLLAVGNRVIRVADGHTVRAFDAGRPVGFTPDGKRIHLGYTRAVRTWDLATGEATGRVAVEDGRTALSPDGRTLAAAGSGAVVLLDPATGRETLRVEVDPGAKELNQQLLSHTYPLGWSADGRTVACAIPGDVVVVIDVTTGRVTGRFHGSPAIAPRPAELAYRDPISIRHVQPSPDGKWVLTANWNSRAAVWEVATGQRVASPEVGHFASFGSFTPDGRAVLLFGSGVGYRWDLLTLLAPDPKATADELWRAAAGDAGPAMRAAVGLVTTGPGRAALQEKLPPAKADFTNAQVKQWVTDLGSETFRTREAASKELAARVQLVTPALRESLRTAPDLEVRRRLEVILARLDRGPTPEELRAMRVVRAAELAGTPEARDLLKLWAAGAAGAVLTEDAAATLVRLGRPVPTGRE